MKPLFVIELRDRSFNFSHRSVSANKCLQFVDIVNSEIVKVDFFEYMSSVFFFLANILRIQGGKYQMSQICVT